MDENELRIIREFIIEKIIREPDMFLKCLDIDVTEQLDLIDVITGLYNMLHKSVTGEDYDYMWHWANKIGFCHHSTFPCITELYKRLSSHQKPILFAQCHI